MKRFLPRILLLLLPALLLTARPADAQWSKKTLKTLAAGDSLLMPTDYQAYKTRGVCLSFTNLEDSVAFVLVWYNGTDTIRTLVPLQDGQGNTVLWANGMNGKNKCYTMAFEFGDRIEAIRPDSAGAGARDSNNVVIQEFRPGRIGVLNSFPHDGFTQLRQCNRHPDLAVIPRKTPLPDTGQRS